MVKQKKAKVYVQFLGFSANPEHPPSKAELAVVKKHGGKLYPVDKLPKGFKISGSSLGGDFLSYKGKTVFRMFWIKKNGKWLNFTHGRISTPAKEWRNYIRNLPWHQKPKPQRRVNVPSVADLVLKFEKPKRRRKAMQKTTAKQKKRQRDRMRAKMKKDLKFGFQETLMELIR